VRPPRQPRILAYPSAGPHPQGALGVQFHVLWFEGSDGYMRAGGLASRVHGLVEGMAGRGQIGWADSETQASGERSH
jgi:hypothetical protein